MYMKKIISVITAIGMSISMLSALTVNAAEKTLAPWSVYFAEKGNNDNFTKWVNAPEYYGSNGYFYTSGAEDGSTVSEVILNTLEDGRIYMRACADSNGYKKSYGSAAIGFTAPSTGSYQIDFTSVQDNRQPHNAASIASAVFGVLDGETVNVFESAPLHGYNVTETETVKRETVVSTTVNLKSGELLTAKFNSSIDGYLRMFYITYKVTDLTTGITYDFNGVGRSANISASGDKNVYNIGECNHSQEVDNSMWSVYLTSNVDDSAWNDMSTWKKYNIEEYRAADTKRVTITSGTTRLSIYDSRPDGWFEWRPAGDNESGGTGTVILGWKAPEAGVYAVEFGAYNKGTDVKGGEPLVHKLAYLKDGETEPVLFERFTSPGSKENKEFSKKYQLKVDAGETLYLLNDAGSDGFGDNADIRFEITNVNDSSKHWSASDMGKTTELTDSQFSIWTSHHNWGTITKDIASYRAAELAYQPDTGNVVTNRWQVPYFLIKPDGTFETIPSGTDGYNNAVMFDVPADGFYRVDFSATNTNAESTDVENAYAALYKLTGRATNIGTELAKSNPIKKNGVYSSISQVVNASRGDKILLNVNTHSDAWMLKLNGTYKITKLDKFNYRYILNGSEITSPDEITAGDELTVKLDYVDEKAQNIMLLLGAYNSEGTMVAFGLSDAAVANPSTPTTLSASITVPDVDGQLTFEAFAVDGINSLVLLDDVNILE